MLEQQKIMHIPSISIKPSRAHLSPFLLTFATLPSIYIFIFYPFGDVGTSPLDLNCCGAFKCFLRAKRPQGVIFLQEHNCVTFLWVLAGGVVGRFDFAPRCCCRSLCYLWRKVQSFFLIFNYSKKKTLGAMFWTIPRHGLVEIWGVGCPFLLAFGLLLELSSLSHEILNLILVFCIGESEGCQLCLKFNLLSIFGMEFLLKCLQFHVKGPISVAVVRLQGGQPHLCHLDANLFSSFHLLVILFQVRSADLTVQINQSNRFLYQTKDGSDDVKITTLWMFWHVGYFQTSDVTFQIGI